MRVNRRNYGCWHLKYLFQENCTQFSPLPAPGWWAPSGVDAAWPPPPSLWLRVARRSPPKAWTCVLHAAYTKTRFSGLRQASVCISVQTNIHEKPEKWDVTMPPHRAHWWQMHFLQVQQKTLSFSWWFSHLQSTTTINQLQSKKTSPEGQHHHCCAAQKRKKMTTGAAPHLSLSLSSCLVRLQSCRVSSCWVTSSAHRQFTSSLSCSGALKISSSTLTQHTHQQKGHKSPDRELSFW